jgi:hypothetical protein
MRMTASNPEPGGALTAEAGIRAAVRAAGDS